MGESVILSTVFFFNFVSYNPYINFVRILHRCVCFRVGDVSCVWTYFVKVFCVVVLDIVIRDFFMVIDQKAVKHEYHFLTKKEKVPLLVYWLWRNRIEDYYLAFHLFAHYIFSLPCLLFINPFCMILYLPVENRVICILRSRRIRDSSFHLVL